MTLPESGVIIDQKLSELLKVNVGDSITIDSDGRHSANIPGALGSVVAAVPVYLIGCIPAVQVVILIIHIYAIIITALNG